MLPWLPFEKILKMLPHVLAKVPAQVSADPFADVDDPSTQVSSNSIADFDDNSLFWSTSLSVKQIYENYFF